MVITAFLFNVLVLGVPKLLRLKLGYPINRAWKIMPRPTHHTESSLPL